jgi:hypothetical protein
MPTLASDITAEDFPLAGLNPGTDNLRLQLQSTEGCPGRLLITEDQRRLAIEADDACQARYFFLGLPAVRTHFHPQDDRQGERQNDKTDAHHEDNQLGPNGQVTENPVHHRSLSSLA